MLNLISKAKKNNKKKSLTVVLFLSQGLYANEAENMVVFFCRATTANVY